jgi:hypothetical protein
VLLLFALPTNCLCRRFSPSRPKSDGQKTDPDELLARSKASGYRRGSIESRARCRIARLISTRPYMIMMAYCAATCYDGSPVYRAVLTQSSRRKLNEIREDVVQRNVTSPDEKTVGERYLGKKVEVSGITIYFLRF